MSHLVSRAVSSTHAQRLRNIKVAVAPTKYARGLSPKTPTPNAIYEVVDIIEALEAEYATDAHLVPYVVPGVACQPRVNKRGLALLNEEPVVQVLFCDVDNPGHAAWSEQGRTELRALCETLEILQTAGVYETKHGYRIVQPLAEPVPVHLIEDYLATWFARLEGAGIIVDRRCRDWTRHFRAPHVRRGGHVYRSPFVALHNMVPIPPSALLPDGPIQRVFLKTNVVVGERAPKKGSGAGSESLRQRLARWLREGITSPGTFHACQVDLAFTLRRQGVSQEECEEKLYQFLFSGRFEHNSTTLKDDPDRAWREVLATIRCLYSDELPVPVWRRGLSSREWQVLWKATARLDGLERYRQLQFMFDVVLEFKVAGSVELDLPRDWIKRFLGAQSGTYQDRIRFMEQAGLVVVVEGAREGRCRRYRLLLVSDNNDQYATVDAALADGDMSFLSEYLRRLVLGNVANKHDASWSKRIGRISNERLMGSRGVSSSCCSNRRKVSTELGIAQEDLVLGDSQDLLELGQPDTADPGPCWPCGVDELTASGAPALVSRTSMPPPCLSFITQTSAEAKPEAFRDWLAQSSLQNGAGACGCSALATGDPRSCDIFNLMLACDDIQLRRAGHGTDAPSACAIPGTIGRSTGSHIVDREDALDLGSNLLMAADKEPVPSRRPNAVELSLREMPSESVECHQTADHLKNDTGDRVGREPPPRGASP